MRNKLVKFALAGIAAAALECAFGIETQGTRAPLNPLLASESYSARQNTPKASVARQFSGRITEIDKQGKTLTIDEKQLGKEILHIGAETRVLRGAANVAWDQIKVGEEVRAIARKSGQISRALIIELAREKNS